MLVPTAPVFAQQAAIEAVNASWTEFFNKGDFGGVASLYTEDATAFPPGSSMVKGRTAIGAMWKSMAEKVSDPKVTTLDVKQLGPSAVREIGTFSLAFTHFACPTRARGRSQQGVRWPHRRRADSLFGLFAGGVEAIELTIEVDRPLPS